MKRKGISCILAFVFMVSLFAGCNSKQPGGQDSTVNSERKAQLVVAMNPIIVLDDTTNIIAFNDVKNAVSLDRKAATLTSLADKTNWIWTYKQGDAWKARGTCGLDKWHNGASISADSLSAYSFANDGTISLMPYTVKAAKLTAYQDNTPPDAGILLSVSGSEEESLCYQMTESGTLAIPADKITAIESVGGVKTGFLAEDGTPRSAVVKFILNTKELWAGEFRNSTAGDGEAVTQLTYPDLTDIAVEAGDMLFISVQLNAKINQKDDITTDDRPGTNGDNTANPDKKPTVTPPDPSETPTEQRISFLDGYDSRFKLVYSQNAAITEKQIVVKLRESMVDLFEADVLTHDDKTGQSEYEILVGLTNRKESVKAYEDLTSYRVNNGSDFIIRMDGKKLVIAANTEYSLKLATEYFMANYCKSDKDSVDSHLNYAYRPNLKNIVLGDASIASYTIRTEKYPSIMTVRAAQKLAEYVVSKTGYNLKIEKDTTTTQNEILVGLTTRSGISSATFQTGSLDFVRVSSGEVYDNEDYKIFMNGTKLFLEAGSDYAASHAVSKLIAHLDKSPSFTRSTVLSGSYQKGEYTLLDGYAYKWGDEFFTSSGSTFNKKNWKLNEKGNYTENIGPWYKKDDPYYLASKASLEDDDPDNDFGGPWLATTRSNYVQEGTVKNLGSNAVIRDNMLVQTSKKDVNGYSGNILCTDGRMEFRYGILETRILAATSNGNAPSFWTRTKDGGGVVNEIDIVETFGEDKFTPNLHTWADTHTDHGAMITLRESCTPENGEHFYDTFHHIAVEWTPDFINMYLDGEVYLSQEITSDTWYAFEETTFVILSNVAPSGTYSHAASPGNWLAGGNIAPEEAARKFDTNGDGKIDISDFYEEQLVDYIRLYQINSRQYSLKHKK